MTGASLIRGDALRLPLADNTVDLIVTSPPYFALRSYQDGGEHYDGQIGSEPTPQAFLEALWAVTAECKRVLRPSGSMFVNLGDKYSGSAGWCNSAAAAESSTLRDKGRQQRQGQTAKPVAPKTSIPAKSLMLLPERYRIGAVDQLGLIARAVIVWDKPNGLPESVTDRVRRSHEDWVHLTKQPRYYAAVDEIREPSLPPKQATASSSPKRVGVPGVRDIGTVEPSPRIYNPLGKLPGSVWRVPSEPLQVPDWLGVQHYAAYPQELPRRLILGWTPPGYCTECGQARTTVVERPGGSQGTAGDVHAGRSGNGSERNRLYRERVANGEQTTITGYSCGCPTPDAPTRPAIVLDPFAGTGTTVMVARALGRYGIGVDLSADYLKLARWRVFHSGHAAKTNQRTWAERQQALAL